MIEKIKNIVSIHGISGNEKPISEFIKNKIKNHVDEIYNDNLGNLIAVKKSAKNSDKKMMFSAHMDVNGLIVTFIDEKGYIRISFIGGLNIYSLIYSKCTFENGVCGVIVPEEGSEKDLNLKNVYLDIGAKSKEEAEELVKVGDIAFLDSDFVTLLNQRVCARGIDDRIGCLLLIEAIENIKDNFYNLYFVFSVQEEVGIRGAKAAAGGIRPDVGIAIDVTDTGDVLGDVQMAINMGEGTAIKIKDSSVICSPIIVDKMTEICKEQDIKYQYEILKCGGTDTSAMQLSGSGALVGCVSIPTRYIHTGFEEIDLFDFEESLKLINNIENSGEIC